ncbi:hypothetical protein B0H11DRAFT_1976796 [Mycena galericulata]|nr:hypothetical protein B0H11DRAFT_1976796 [Mycena galericulata]
MSSRLPNEMLLKIVEHLPRDELQVLCLTSHTFKSFSRPHLFSDLVFHPYAIGGDGLMLPSPAEVDAYLQRLNFWSSDEIAPFVRSCTIQPWYGRENCVPAEAPYILLAAFFEHLDRFGGLERLHAMEIDFTHAGLAALGRSSVRDVTINMSRLPPLEGIDFSSLALNVSSFCNGDIRLDPQWISLLRPQYLRKLQLRNHQPLEFLGNNTDSLPSFSLVEVLSLHVDTSQISHHLSLLTKFPAVQVLSLQPLDPNQHGGPLPEIQFSELFPVLREYTGTSETVPLFLPLRTLERVAVDTRCNSERFATRLRGVGSPTNVSSLNAKFYGFAHDKLDTICTVFPALVELSIDIWLFGPEQVSVPSKATSFFRMLTEKPTLPATLERLAICWDLRGHNAEPPNRELPALPALRDALLAGCPNLQCFWLDGHDFMFQWRRWPGGRVVERTATNSDDTEVLRKDFDAFWEAR